MRKRFFTGGNGGNREHEAVDVGTRPAFRNLPFHVFGQKNLYYLLFNF